MAEPSKKPGLVYTFYSYKGGVGRSMALVNVGVLMATEGYRVLLVDWDLEAPGLEVYFRNATKLSNDPASTPGIVDLLDAHAQGTPLQWRDCLLRAEFFGKSLDIISAGRRTEDYRRRVQQLDWDTLFREHRIGNFINTLREEWRDAYDFVLVDSRTGITDIGDVCTVILPDVLVLLFVTNHQNVEGIKTVMARAVKARSKLPVNRSKLLAVPVPTRDERDRESDKFPMWRDIFAKEFGDLYCEWLPKEVSPTDALHRIYLPYVAAWSFGERIPVIESERERNDPSSLGASYARLATLLSHRLDWSAIEGKASNADVLGARVELSKAREDAKRHEDDARLEEAKRREVELKLEEAQKAAAKSKKRIRNAVLVSLIVLAILAALLLPALLKAKGRAVSISCMSNMKQIDLSFRIWANDHEDEFPFNVSTNKDGSKEFCDLGPDGFDKNGFLHLRTMSNELITPKLLVCPSDSKQPVDVGGFPSLGKDNVTYQVRSGKNVDEVNPNEILLRCPIHGHVGYTDGSVRAVSDKK